MSKNKDIVNNGAKTREQILKEEAIQSPGRVLVKTFSRNRLGMIGLVGFILVFLTTFLGSLFVPFDPFYMQGTMKYIPPGYGYMKIPEQMQKEGIRQIASGITFSVGVSDAGKIYQWGYYADADLKMPAEIAEQLQNVKVKQVAAGDRHILVLTEDNKIIGWGNDSFGQAKHPSEKDSLIEKEGIAKIGAGESFSCLLTEKGTIYVWGATLPNKLNRIPLSYNQKIVDFKTGGVNMLVLLKDGSLSILGQKGSELDSKMPEELTKPGNKIKSFDRTQYSGAVVLEDGTLISWGNPIENPTAVPKYDGKAVEVVAGKNHFTLRTDTGHVASWGQENYKVTEAPEIKEANALYAGFFNNYAVMKDNHKYEAWGLNGFPFGTDDNGRDVAIRLIHGGKMTLMVAAAAVAIQVTIGVIVGLIGGFYGGTVDNLLMRFAEIISSFPFLPLVITLSAILPPDLSQYKRLLMIMVLLGVLGWTGIARLIRGQILAEREKDYITAAKALGLRDKKIILSHILPNVVSIIIVQITLGYAGNLLSESALSFLGFGVMEPNPSWGNMMNSAQQPAVVELYWWCWIFPGMAVFLTTLTVNLIGDALRDCLDPKASER